MKGPGKELFSGFGVNAVNSKKSRRWCCADFWPNHNFSSSSIPLSIGIWYVMKSSVSTVILVGRMVRIVSQTIMKEEGRQNWMCRPLCHFTCDRFSYVHDQQPPQVSIDMVTAILQLCVGIGSSFYPPWPDTLDASATRIDKANHTMNLAVFSQVIMARNALGWWIISETCSWCELDGRKRKESGPARHVLLDASRKVIRWKIEGLWFRSCSFEGGKQLEWVDLNDFIFCWVLCDRCV
jgi:hypothetical protein